MHGEVYEVDDKMLEVLDALEDHPKVYERKVSLCSIPLTLQPRVGQRVGQGITLSYVCHFSLNYTFPLLHVLFSD